MAKSQKGGDVSDWSRVLMASLVGAGAGAALGYLYLTEGGTRFRLQLEPRIDDFMSEIRRMRTTVEKARAAAGESWRTLGEVAGQPSGTGRWEETRGTH